MNLDFFICRHCGNIITKVKDAGVPVMCCGEKMVKLEPNTVEASNEKHLPAVEINGDILTASVGSVAHPMLPEHSIQWICLLTDKGAQFKELQPGEAPKAVFALNGEKPLAVYAYCNLHGLWKTEL